MQSYYHPQEIVMIYIDSLRDSLSVFQALDSDIRLQILELLTENRKMNMNEIARSIGLSNAAISVHMKKLSNAGIISISSVAGKRGTQKICHLNEDSILIKLTQDHPQLESYDVQLNIGYYSSYSVTPTCGLSSHEHLIGALDQPQFFASPERFQADILWFTQGYVEYLIPDYLTSNQELHEIQFSFEISSEAPGFCESWPSDIYFYLNSTLLGTWTCPGDFGETSGRLNPAWWPRINQYGLLKLLTINRQGTFIDGLQLSDITIQDIKKDTTSGFLFRLSVPSDAKHVGGLTLYGKNFGNYHQGIRVKVLYQ